MPLPSQTARAGSQTGRTNMYRAKRSDPKPIIAAAGAVVVFGLGVWGLAKFLAPRHAEAETPPTSLAGGPAIDGPSQLVKAVPPAAQPTRLLATDAPLADLSKPDLTNNAGSKPADPPPFELRQGRGSAGPSAAAMLSEQPASQPLGHTRGVPPSTSPAAPTERESTSSPAPAPTPVAPPPVHTPDPVTPRDPLAQGSGPSLGGVNISASGAVATTLAAANQKLMTGDPVAARLLYSQALRDATLTDSDRSQIRETVTKINDDLVFSPRITPGDPFVDAYLVQSGDRLIKISQKLALAPDFRLVKRINHLNNEHDLKVGQKLKIVKGPFNAIVSKSAFRMDVYMGQGDNPDNWVYVRSFRVGLGEQGSTPIGTFRPKKGSKLVDPPWINPHTGEKFAGGDPKNPIGKFWVGLEGVGDASQYTGYGIHGTIDPDSIGQQKSMGCVRMAADDIALVFELMGEQVSVVKIVP